ncbi:MAG: FKBP-type peptidyl-prolyl cis-trans isomerase [Sphingomonadales bacterium]|nr:FKBP-type peptidyl-prolyl cis-trans isomerase [Sphingomonadales bacterium]
MTEITRVPLQPVAKGSITKLWAGVAAALLVAGGIAFAAKPPLVGVKTVVAGHEGSPTMEDVVKINYVGKLKSGKVFDQGQGAIMPVAGVIPGFSRALLQMQKGGKYTVSIPAKLGYGAAGAGPIPPNSDLVFDIDLLDYMNAKQYQQQMMMMQQLQRMQGHGGAPGAPEGAAPEGAAPEAPAQ